MTSKIEHKNDQIDRGGRLDFMRIDEAMMAELRVFWPILEPELPRILDGFYRHVTRNPTLAAMIGARTENLKAVQGNHWRRLFTSGFDQGYIDSVRTIGLTHNRIGLEPRWYIGGYNFVMRELMTLVVSRNRWSPRKAASILSAVSSAVMLDMDFAISVYQEAMLAERQKRQDGVEAAIREFGEMSRSLLGEVTDAASSMQATAQSLTDTAERAASQAVNVAAASEQASTNVQTVAAAAEELSSSIHEIGRQVGESTRITTQAVSKAEETNVQIKGLSDAAQKIGDVVKLISDIAGQTNLLALNATIEAARAGDAGKGFAVVASEVKTLATQTAQATDEISGKVAEMQAATTQAVQAIQGITETIRRIDEIATGIAAAVEEQGTATNEIARNVQQAAIGTQEVSSNIVGITQAAQDTGTGAGMVVTSAATVSGQAASLRGEIERFFDRIKSA
jgi:methyl-accepting chemotaxis protein